MANNGLSKAEIVERALEFGAEFVGFAPVERWREFNDVPEAFHPQQIWGNAKSVIVVGVPLWLPLIDAAPNVLGREQAIVTNDLLAEVGYRLTLLLSRSGFQALNVPQTGHRDIVPTDSSLEAFPQSWAGYYAGLGTIGWNHTLLTREYGPRLQLGSVFTSLEIEGDPMLENDLCIKCLNCKRICPAQALTGDNRTAYAQVDYTGCIQNETRLQAAYCEPCGACIKVCPVGEDRKLFQSNNFEKYLKEENILAEDANAKEYRDWVHIRSYGSYSLARNK